MISGFSFGAIYISDGELCGPLVQFIIEVRSAISSPHRREAHSLLSSHPSHELGVGGYGVGGLSPLTDPSMGQNFWKS